MIGLEEYGRRRRELEQRIQSFDQQERELEGQVEREHKIAELTNHIEVFSQGVQQGLSEASYEQKRQLVGQVSRS